MRWLTVVGMLGFLIMPAAALERFEPREYLPVQDDAELGEAVLWQVIADGFRIEIERVVELHDTFDLYPEEIVMALTIATLANDNVNYVCELRAKRHESWKGIAEALNLNPRHFYQDANWYTQGDRSEWYRSDIDIERDFMIPLLAHVYGVEDRLIWGWHRDGLGFGDLAVVLWLSRESKRPVDELLYLKQNRQWRWQTLAEFVQVDLTPIYRIRALHYHNPRFEPYYVDDHRIYHPYRAEYRHFDRREYHHYGVWIIYADGYCHHDYWYDYDPYFWYGRCSYAYYYPVGFDWYSEWRWSYWGWPRYHFVWRPERSYRGPYANVPPPASPDPIQRDGRRYGQVLADQLRVSSSAPSSVRYTPTAVVRSSSPVVSTSSASGPASSSRTDSGARKGGGGPTVSGPPARDRDDSGSRYGTASSSSSSHGSVSSGGSRGSSSGGSGSSGGSSSGRTSGGARKGGR